jgi:hypothetical protein
MFNFLAGLFGSRKRDESGSANKKAAELHRKARLENRRRRRVYGNRRSYRGGHRLLQPADQVPGPDVTEEELLRHPWYRNQNGFTRGEAEECLAKLEAKKKK